MQRVLFVDATEELRPLSGALEAAGFDVSHAALERVFETPGESAPVVVLSLLGRGDAAAVRGVLRSGRRPQQTAVIAVVREEQLAGLDFTLGLDDFVVHPALDGEVVARVRHAIWMKSGVGSDNTLRAGDLVIDLSNYKVFISGRPVDLTYKEYELLRFLATNRDKVFTREALLNRVWGYDFYGGARTVDVHVRRLRSKIEDGTHTFIETVRNVGYRFVSR
ncbi:MAG TPA: response regulator transcription factor [Dehalococcoidia bacterium]|nr:response regulator transcription factor [Dehalococcoidia bacterium]